MFPLGSGRLFANDVRSAWRQVRHAPRVALGVSGLLGLGIFGVITLAVPLRVVVLSDLPFRAPEQLVVVDAPILDPYTASFVERRALDPIFSGIAAYKISDYSQTASPSIGERPIRTAVSAVTPEFFSAMGVSLWRGSGLEEEATSSAVAVVSHEFWRSKLKESDPSDAPTLAINGAQLDVIGVASPGFDFPEGTEIWVPSRNRAVGSSRPWVVVGRLQPDQTAAVAAARLQALLARVPAAGTVSKPPRATLQPLRTFLLGERRSLVWLLFAMSVLFLLLTCSGVTNLLWVRSLRRSQELSIRLALGSSRAELVRQLLTETTLLVSGGAILGMGLSFLGIRFLTPVIRNTGAGTESLKSPTSLLILLAIVLIATILCGLAPAVRASRAAARLSQRSGHSSMSPVGGSWRRISVPESLACAQLVLAMVFLVCTALLCRSLMTTLSLPLGFEPHDVIVMQIDVPPPNQSPSRESAPQPSADQQADLYKRNEASHAAVIEQLQTTPGVLAIGEIFPLPFAKGGTTTLAANRIDADGTPSPDFVLALVRGVGLEAFRVIGVSLLAGRSFLREEAVLPALFRASTDANTSQFDAAMVNQTLASRLWPGQDAIGKRLSFLGVRTVVGIVSDVHESSDRLDVQPTVYVPSTPHARIWNFVIKPSPDVHVSTLANSLRAGITKVVPHLPVPTVGMFSDSVDESLRSLRFGLILLACFATMGTLVAGLGVYATASETAVMRVREMGVRTALGAAPRDLYRHAIWRSLRIAFIAIPLGGAGSWILAQTLSHWFQVGSFDPTSFVVCSGILIAVAFLASVRPALRVAAINPAVALRSEA